MNNKKIWGIANIVLGPIIGGLIAVFVDNPMRSKAANKENMLIAWSVTALTFFTIGAVLLIQSKNSPASSESPLSRITFYSS